jgi:nucleoid DNA-binding protein
MATRLDLVNIIANRHNITELDSKKIIEIIFEYLANQLSKKERIEIRNFGSFVVKSKKINLNWINKHSLCNKDFYNVINYKISSTLHLKLNKNLK